MTSCPAAKLGVMPLLIINCAVSVPLYSSVPAFSAVPPTPTPNQTAVLPVAPPAGNVIAPALLT